MKTKLTLFACALLLVACATPKKQDIQPRGRWSAEQAAAWHATQPWLVGANFGPSTAINQLEMWQAEYFDPETIDRELGWAADLGFNSMRVFLHNLVWDADPDAYLKRIDRFLDIADKHGIGIMMVPLDGVWDPQPALGKQRAPKPHVHNSGWMQAPGAAIMNDPSRHEELKPFIQGVIGHFRNDPRIQIWDLFNEGDNPNANSYGTNGSGTELLPDRKSEMAIVLTKKLFEWAREMNPSQPITSGIWRGDWSSHESMDEFSRVCIDESDIVTFHNYGSAEDLQNRINQLKRYNRPMYCTEYMARPNNSYFDPHMGIMKRENVGVYNWGFVAGKTQTIYPWETWQKQYDAEPEVWFHDIFRADGSIYRQEEVDYIRSLTGAAK